jgi:hypothetical protein
MTQSADLRAAAKAQLIGKTDAGSNVYSPLDRPTWSGNYPVLFLSTPEENKESLGPNGAPQFEVTMTLRVVARVQQNQQKDDAGAAAAMAALESLQQQIEVALINNPAIMGLIEEYPFVRATNTITGEGESQLGELVMDIGLKFYQGPEDFYQIQTEELEEITIDGDLQNVFDPNGMYPNPPFPASVTPAPRTQGPDGRAEVGADIELPQ